MSPTVEELMDALHLPDQCRVLQRVPKKLLAENGASTAADRRLINDGIAEMQWLATLKPANIGVPEYRDATRDYVEIAVLAVAARGKGSISRLTQIVQRAVPYPVLLLVSGEEDSLLSLAHKRRALSQPDKMVMDETFQSVFLEGDVHEKYFWQSMAIERQPQTSLLALYSGWMDCALALAVARLENHFQLSASPQESALRYDAIQEYHALQASLAAVRAQAAKEKQLARRVELNTERRRLEEQLEETRRRL